MNGIQDLKMKNKIKYDYYKIKNYIENEWNPRFEDEK